MTKFLSVRLNNFDRYCIKKKKKRKCPRDPKYAPIVNVAKMTVATADAANSKGYARTYLHRKIETK